MAAINLAGNIQPPSVEGGRNVPQPIKKSSTSVVEKVETAETAQSVASKNINQFVQNEVNNQNDKEIEQEINNQVEELKNFNQSIDRTLQFKVDEELGVTIVRVIDRETKELVRQFPPEELLNLSRKLKDLNEQDSDKQGILLQVKA